MISIVHGFPVGTHLLLNLYDVPHHAAMQSLVEELLRDLGLHIISQSNHPLPRMGHTYAFVLSDGHCTIHTYPDNQSCYLDLFCCHSTIQPLSVINRIKAQFHTENVQYQLVRR
jgi:S-adenosylmethionine decarboxylase